jgi:hypothetical protein
MIDREVLRISRGSVYLPAAPGVGFRSGDQGAKKLFGKEKHYCAIGAWSGARA